MVHPSQEAFCRLWGQLMARAWDDAAFKRRLVADPAGVLREHGYELPPGTNVRLQVVESDEQVQYLYLPCEGELPTNSSEAAGQVAGECLNNRLALARLAAEGGEAGSERSR
jgi:hypothetical protein